MWEIYPFLVHILYYPSLLPKSVYLALFQLLKKEEKWWLESCIVVSAVIYILRLCTTIYLPELIKSKCSMHLCWNYSSICLHMSAISIQNNLIITKKKWQKCNNDHHDHDNNDDDANENDNWDYEDDDTLELKSTIHIVDSLPTLTSNKQHKKHAWHTTE